MIVVPVGPAFCLATTTKRVVAWVTTSVGLPAELPDGSTIAPPWTLCGRP